MDRGGTTTTTKHCKSTRTSLHMMYMMSLHSDGHKKSRKHEPEVCRILRWGTKTPAKLRPPAEAGVPEAGVFTTLGAPPAPPSHTMHNQRGRAAQKMITA